MTTSATLTVWGPQAGSKLASEDGWLQQEAVVFERVQHALARHTPTMQAQRVCVAQDCRMHGGVRCYGYVITVVVLVGADPTAPGAVSGLECQVESLIGVALLDLLGPIEIEHVELVSEDGDSTIPA